MKQLVAGDEVITKELWHMGENLCGRLGKVIDTSSYILIEVYEYIGNPIKCFRSEVEFVYRDDNTPGF